MAASNRPVRRRSTEIAPRRPQPLTHRPKPRPHQPSATAARSRGRANVGGLVALPWPVRTLLLAGLLGLAALAILLGGGTLAHVTAGIGGALGHAFGGFFPSGAPAASSSEQDIPTPQLDPPVSAYTQLPSVDISGHLPGDVAGTSDTLVVYVGGVRKASQPVPSTNDFTVTAVPLVEGPNVITASLLTPDGESGPSAPITITFDDQPPPLTITSPKDGAAVTTATVAVKGTTQPGATVTVRDANSGGIPSVTANAAGAFGINVTLAQGANVLTITAVDPAGNRTTKTLTVTHGSGALKAKLTMAWSSRSNKNVASSPLTITVLVNDATGKPITVGATATFTVSPPGQPAIVSGDPPVSLRHGVGSWTVTIAEVDASHVALPQDGFVTVTVALADGRTITARGTFTITK